MSEIYYGAYPLCWLVAFVGAGFCGFKIADSKTKLQVGCWVAFGALLIPLWVIGELGTLSPP